MKKGKKKSFVAPKHLHSMNMVTAKLSDGSEISFPSASPLEFSFPEIVKAVSVGPVEGLVLEPAFGIADFAVLVLENGTLIMECNGRVNVLENVSRLKVGRNYRVENTGDNFRVPSEEVDDSLNIMDAVMFGLRLANVKSLPYPTVTRVKNDCIKIADKNLYNLVLYYASRDTQNVDFYRASTPVISFTGGYDLETGQMIPATYHRKIKLLSFMDSGDSIIDVYPPQVSTNVEFRRGMNRSSERECYYLPAVFNFSARSHLLDLRTGWNTIYRMEFSGGYHNFNTKIPGLYVYGNHEGAPFRFKWKNELSAFWKSPKKSILLSEILRQKKDAKKYSGGYKRTNTAGWRETAQAHNQQARSFSIR